METIMGKELWSKTTSDGGTDLFALVITRADCGVYAGWSRYTANIVDPEEISRVAVAVGLPCLPWADLTAIVDRDFEFRTWRAATRWGEKTMTRITAARLGADGWCPRTGWRRLYSGPQSFIEFKENAARERNAAKVLAMTEKLKRASERTVHGLTDQEYADHRRLKIELKIELAKLHGGNNA